MAEPVVQLWHEVSISASAEEVFDIFSNPEALMDMLSVTKAHLRKRSGRDKWTARYQSKLGQRDVALEITQKDRPSQLNWRTMMQGFQGETLIKLSPKGAAETLVKVRTTVRAKTLRARLMAPLVKLARKRLKRGQRKGLRMIAAAIDAKHV